MSAAELNRQALDPAASVVVEACAGSGKTWLLVSRIVRLLLAGAQPSDILAITFTRKAAQEMAGRLRDWLRLLALAPDEEVRQFLRERAVPEAGIEALLPRARGLFEQFLTASPGITINTFHGWFLQLLQRAPLDSGLGADWGLLDQASALLEEAWERFAEDLRGAPGSDAAQALDDLFTEYGLHGSRSLLLDFVAKRAEWWAYTDGQNDPVGFALAALLADLGVDPALDVRAEVFGDQLLAHKAETFAALLEKGTNTDLKHAAQLRAALPAKDFDALCGVFLTGEGEPRKREYTKALAGRLGAETDRFLELHQTFAARLQLARQQLAAQAAYRFNAAGLRCGVGLLEAYQRLKDERRAIDFTDVEWRVHRLLNHSDHAEYMQYKLDSRYRHILLDEFQDTNPLQWQIMRAWLDASAGAGSRPTVFLVGDPKQAIYRFRRADARLFGMAADFLEREFGAHRLQQNTSRRSAPAVLEAVNRLFAPEPVFAGFESHQAHHTGLAGRVEVLPLLADDVEEAAAEAAGAALRNPLHEPAEEDEDRRVESEARQLAEKLTALVGVWRITDEQGRARPAEYRDILLLKRNRTRLEIFERALRAAGIPYVSSRQGGLLETLECRDLTALLTFLITPFADLHLAQALRSPLFGCSDDDLQRLARLPEGSWWARLQALAVRDEAGPALARAAGLLQGWLGLTDTLPVHDLLDRIYFEGELPQRYAAAVPEAMRGGVLANLHAFMELALNVDSGRYPSLPKFINELQQLRRARAEEAPDEGIIGDAGNAVRILTIHGAKGLEAPIVWLLDAQAAKRNDRGQRTLVDWPPASARPRQFFLYAGKAERAAAWQPVFDSEAQLEQREDLNLLYVAMTRARQALIVSGCQPKKGDTGDGWHSKIQRALPSPSPFEKGRLGGDLSAGDLAAAAKSPLAPLCARAADYPGLPVLSGVIMPTGQRVSTRQTAEQRHGIRLHALLEWLAPPAAVLDRAWLQDRLEVEGAEFDALWQEAGRIMQSAQLQRFFDPACYLRAWKELPYRSAGGESRRIDRLVEFADSVWILDFKATDKVGTGSLAACAAPYLGQMGEYRAAMRAVFAGKPVKTALVFSNGLLFEVEE